LKRLRILVLTHESLVPPDTLEGYSEQEIDEWRTEYDVIARSDALGVVVRGDRRVAARRFERLLTRLVGDRHRGAGPRLPV